MNFKQIIYYLSMCYMVEGMQGIALLHTDSPKTHYLMNCGLLACLAISQFIHSCSFEFPIVAVLDLTMIKLFYTSL